MINFKLEKILIATDGTPASQTAIKAGIYLAKNFGSKIYGICVGQIPLPGLPVIEAMEKRAKEIVDQLKAEVEKEGIECEAIPELADEVEDCIIEEAKKRNVDLVIVGKKKKRPIFTSVAIPLTAHCPLDVLVVPEESKPDFTKILIAVDGSVYSELAAKKGFEMAKKLRSEILVISVAETEEDVPYAEEAIELTQYVAEKEGVSMKSIIERGKPTKKIIEYAENNNVGLIIMGSHGKSSEDYAIGDVIRKVLEVTKIPVMVVKRPK